MFDTLTEEEISFLKYHVSIEKPFGPENSRQVKDNESRIHLFNQNNELCKEYKHNPGIIVGRRGSGKTAIISNTSILERHTYIIKPNPEELIESVKSIVYPSGSEDEQFIESVAKIWTITLNSILMARVVKHAPLNELNSVRAYLATCEIPIDSHLSDVFGIFRKRAEDLKHKLSGFVINTLLDSMNFSERSYELARNDLDIFLQTNKQSTVIIIDSLDDYRLNNWKNASVLSGLLKCVGEYGNPFRHIRLCIPGEAYFDVRSCSNNPLKDFTRNLLLHWLPAEIYGIIACRYALFCRLYDYDAFQEIRKENLGDRRAVIRVINEFLPKTVVNALGLEEPTLPYIMRHTQMLPRQVIVVLNRIFGAVGIRENKITTADSVKIIEGVRDTEGLLCEEIFSAFQYKHPHAQKFCNAVLPELPRVFSNGDLQKVFNWHGKGVYKTLGIEPEFREFKRMLVEMGVVGRVRDTTDIYAEAEFEYAQPGRLNLSVDDELCLHPIFSGEFSSKHNNGDGLVVYPQKEWFDEDRGRHLRVRGGDL